ncbi:LppU/SCO3897 family protein [Lentzea sp. NPDC054927]
MSTPNEPERPKSAELYEPPAADPFSAFAPPPAEPPPSTGGGRPIGYHDVPEPVIPVAPHRESGGGGKIVAVLAVFALALGGLIYWLSTKDTIKFGSGSAPTSAAAVTTTPPTTTSKPAPFATVGDCVLMTGFAAKPDYQKVPCGGNNNYTVSKVSSSSTEKCGEPADGYIEYRRISVLESSTVCLIPVFLDGQCYDFTLADLKAEVPKAECGGGPQVFKAAVLANTVDKAACTVNQALALAYPEIKTTYCFSQPS